MTGGYLFKMWGLPRRQWRYGTPLGRSSAKVGGIMISLR
jgi:hypothetical protein